MACPIFRRLWTNVLQVMSRVAVRSAKKWYIYCNLSYFGGCGVWQFIDLMLTDGYYMYFHCVGGGFGGKGTASVRLAVTASVAAFKLVLPHLTQKLRSHFCSLLMTFDLNVCLSLLAFGAAPRPSVSNRPACGGGRLLEEGWCGG